MHFRYKMNSWSQIQELLGDFENNSIFLVSDIDNSILKTYPTFIGNTLWIDYQFSLLQDHTKKQYRIASNVDKLLEKIHKCTEKITMKPMDENINSILQKYDSLLTSTREMKSINTIYNKLNPYFNWKSKNDFHVIKNNRFLYKYGMTFTGGHSKANAIYHILQYKNIKYDYFVVVDSNVKNICEIESIFPQQNIISIVFANNQKKRIWKINR